MSVDGGFQLGMDLGPPSGARNASIARKRPTQSALPGVAGYVAEQAIDDQQTLQHYRAGLALCGLVKYLKNGQCRADNCLSVLDAKKHAHTVDKSC